MYCLQGYLYQTVDTQNWQGRLGPGRPVRPGPRGGLTGCPVAGLA
jgi:hypothetical protein